MTVKPFILFICCLGALGNAYAIDKKIKKVKDPVLYVVDYIPLVAPNEFNFRLAGEFYISNDDIYSKEVIYDKQKIKAIGYKDIDTLIVIITNGYHNRPEEIKRIPSFYNISMSPKDRKLYAKDNDEPFTGQFINYYFFGKMFSKGKVLNGWFDDTTTYYYEDGITPKVSATYKKGKLNGVFTQYFVNGRLKLTGLYNDSIRTGNWVEWYSTGKIKRRFLYENGKMVIPKEDQKWTALMEKAKKYKEDKNFEMAFMCIADAIVVRPDLSDLYYLKGNMELEQKHYHDAIHDFNIAIKLEPLFTEAIADRIVARIGRLEAPGSTRTLRVEYDTTPEEEKEKICNDLNVLGMCQKMDRYVSLNLPLRKNARDAVLNTMKKYCQ